MKNVQLGNRINKVQVVASAAYVSKKVIAARYSVTIGCINNWMRERRLPFLRLSAQLVRFNINDCDRAIERYRVNAL